MTEHPTDSSPAPATTEVARLLTVMARLRRECPWDREQTHRSLTPYLIEETYEVVEAIEAGQGAGAAPPADLEHLREELGDLLLQVVFHAQIAAERPGGFTLDDVAAGIADKLVRRHPHVFAGAEVGPDGLSGLNRSWEERKAAEKGRTSVLEGIPEQLPSLARATKIINRARTRGLDIDVLPGDDVGAKIIALVLEANREGVDADQSVRDALRVLESEVRAAETDAG